MRLEKDDSILDAVLANLPGVAFRCLNDRAWTMLYMSEGLRDLAGYDVADIIGNGSLSYADLIHPDDRDMVWGQVQRALKERRTYQAEYRLIKADGENIWVWEQGRGAFDEQGQVRFLDGVVIDANARVAEETSLRRSREQLQAILDVTPFPVALVDVESTNIEYWSKSAQDLLGYSASTAREWYHLAYPDPEYRRNAVDRWLEVVARARAAPGTPIHGGEYRVSVADGSTRDCELYAAFVADRLVVTMNDITARERAADELRASEERFRTLVEEAPIAIMVQTGGAYRYANRAARLLYGESEGRPLVGRKVVDVTHPDYREVVRERMQVVRERQAVPTIRFNVLTLDGRTVETESSAVPVSYEGENGSLVFMTDITDRIRAEQEIRLRDEQLQQSQKMEAIGRLAGGVAHDFNNLLTAVLGYSDLILGGDLSRPEEFRADVLEIKHAAVRAKELTSQILAFSRRQPRQPRVVRANDLIRESEALLRRSLGEDVELQYRLARDAGSIEVDPGQFTQVLLNLALNARDAMPGGGRLMVDTSLIRYDGSPWMRLTVADTGHGMDAETVSRVFEPFFTTKKTSEGTGLGLATVYGIVAQSGGKISVSSEPGAGSIFTVLLASVPDAEMAAQRQESSVPRPVRASEKRSATILVVEDEPAVRDLTARVLEQQGYQVLVAADGSEAAALARDPAVSIDMLLTDVVLAGDLQGDGVARMVLEGHPGIKCMFMSGYPREVIAKAGRLAEGVNYLEKPFSLATLVRRVRELIDAE
jgi:two-component system, cell cycle sensor histidine kinase and response regulator CckA